MTTDHFEATWYPRIGKDAAENLRAYRRVSTLLPLNVLFTVGAGALIGTGTFGTVLGVLLAIAFFFNVGLWFRAQWRTAAAISVWFGVTPFRWLPRMTPERWDEWAQLRGLTPDTRLEPNHGDHYAP